MFFSAKLMTLALALAIARATPVAPIAPVTLTCPIRDYDFESLTPGTAFNLAADEAWSITVTPTLTDTTDCSAIFNTNFPLFTDRDLGTPGECANGPGLGAGGRRGERGENCEMLGNSLLCHGGDIEAIRTCKCSMHACANCNPDDRADGSVFNITFNKELVFNAFTMIDLEKSPAMVITYPDGKTFAMDGYGDNSVQRIRLGLSVMPGDSVILRCLESCALARVHINICDDYNALETVDVDDDDGELPAAVVINVTQLFTGSSGFTHNLLAADIEETALPIPPSDANTSFALPIPSRPNVLLVDVHGHPIDPSMPPIGMQTLMTAMPEVSVMPAESFTPGPTTNADVALFSTFGPEASVVAEPNDTAEPSYVVEPSPTTETTDAFEASYSPESSIEELALGTIIPEVTAEISATPELLLPQFAFTQSQAFEAFGLRPSESPFPSSIVVPVDVTFESILPYSCDQHTTPITFNNRPLGSAVTGGYGFSMHTRRIGHDKNEDVSAVFDTSKPSEYDLDLGSPNSECYSGGPGHGEGGAPGKPGENCEPLGSVLVAHQGNVSALRAACAICPDCIDCSPNDTWMGAEFKITFTMPSLLHNVVMLDVDEVPSSLVITMPTGKVNEYVGTGENGKMVVDLGLQLVNAGQVLKIYCKGSCALVRVGRTLCTNTAKPVMAPPAEDTMCKTVRDEFEGHRTGMPVESGEHWTLETCRFVNNTKQCGVSAAFNTSDPVADVDLGTPNMMCPGGGPGLGLGGQPGSRGENCESLKQVLIALGGDVGEMRRLCSFQTCHPNDHAGGAEFKWIFNASVTLRNITMLDLDALDAEGSSAMLKFPGGHVLPLNGLGDNSVQTINLTDSAPKHHTLSAGQSIVLTCHSSCAVTSLVYHTCA